MLLACSLNFGHSSLEMAKIPGREAVQIDSLRGLNSYCLSAFRCF